MGAAALRTRSNATEGELRAIRLPLRYFSLYFMLPVYLLPQKTPSSFVTSDLERPRLVLSLVQTQCWCPQGRWLPSPSGVRSTRLTYFPFSSPSDPNSLTRRPAASGRPHAHASSHGDSAVWVSSQRRSAAGTSASAACGSAMPH